MILLVKDANEQGVLQIVLEAMDRGRSLYERCRFGKTEDEQVLAQGKKPVLAIEVDGYRYHKEDTVQASRDLLKNHIMGLYEIPLLRFRTNGSGEKEKIIEMLDELVG